MAGGSWKRWTRRGVAATVGLVVLGNGVVGYMATSLPAQRRLFGEGEGRDRTPADVGLPYDEITYGPGRTGWYLRAPGDSRATVILVHGFETRPDSIRHSPNPLIDVARMLHDEGYSVLIPRLGYATGAHPFSAGRLEAGDVAAATRLAEERSNMPVVLWGFSAGAHAVLTAVRDGTSPQAVIADSGFADGAGIVRQQAARATHLPTWLFFGVRPVMTLITGNPPVDLTDPAPSDVPVLVIHGANDTAVDVENLRTLTRSFAAESWVVESVDHTRAFYERSVAYRTRSLAFIENALQNSG
jgi:alpha-beta hydrolase superfamily lysophospholipase